MGDIDRKVPMAFEASRLASVAYTAVSNQSEQLVSTEVKDEDRKLRLTSHPTFVLLHMCP